MTTPRLRARAIGLALLLLGAPALGAEKDDARAAFQAGVKAFQDGGFEQALARFQEADRLGHAPAITYNIARTYEKLERPQEALDAYEAYVAEAGEGGEFTGSAVVAITQLKARSTRLSIESTPPGAEVTLDGRALVQKTPVTVLVPRGPHRIALALDAWREERAYEAPGGGSTGQLMFVRSSDPAAAPTAAPPPVAAPGPERRARVLPLPVEVPKLDGLLGSVGLSLSAYRFIGSADETSGSSQTTSESAAGGLVFGLTIDVGYALGARTALMLRLFGGLGSAEQALATLGMAGPVLTYRISNSWWTGGGIAVGAGRADSDAKTNNSGAILDSQITFKTNVALGPTLELGYVIDQNQNGHWLVELMPTVLFTLTRESTIFVPLTLGYRWF
jgi:hypothetical protein